jgi:hypothetical protein
MPIANGLDQQVFVRNLAVTPAVPRIIPASSLLAVLEQVANKFVPKAPKATVAKIQPHRNGRIVRGIRNNLACQHTSRVLATLLVLQDLLALLCRKETAHLDGSLIVVKDNRRQRSHQETPVSEMENTHSCLL